MDGFVSLHAVDVHLDGHVDVDVLVDVPVDVAVGVRVHRRRMCVTWSPSTTGHAQ